MLLHYSSQDERGEDSVQHRLERRPPPANARAAACCILMQWFFTDYTAVNGLYTHVAESHRRYVASLLTLCSK